MPNVLIDGEVDPRVYQQSNPSQSQPKPSPKPRIVGPASRTEVPDVSPRISGPTKAPTGKSHPRLREGVAERTVIRSPRAEARAIHSLRPEPPKPAQEPQVFEPVAVQPIDPLGRSGTVLNPGAYYERPGGQVDPFLEAWFEHSPWGIFTPEGPPKAEGKNRYKVLAGAILGEITTAGTGYLAGVALGGYLTSPSLRFLTGESMKAQAIRGTLKGMFVVGESMKAVNMLQAGYDPLQVAIDIGGDFGAFYAFEKGVASARYTVVKKNRFLEGNLVEVDEFKGEQLVQSTKVLSKRVKGGDQLVGTSVYRPGEGHVVTVQVHGSREVDLRLANVYSSEGYVPRRWNVPGVKWLKASEGGLTRFSLYDPVVGRVVQKTSPLEVPGMRAVVETLIRPPAVKPPSLKGLGSVAGVVGLVGVQKPPKPQEVVTPSPALEVQKPRKSEGSRQVQTQVDVLDYKPAFTPTPRTTEIPLETETEIPAEVTTPKPSTTLMPKERPVESETSLPDITPAIRSTSKPKPPVVGQVQEPLQITYEIPKETRVPRVRDVELLKAAPPTPGTVPLVGMAMPSFGRPSANKPRRKNKSRRSRRGGRSDILGELDLFAQGILDIEGIEVAKISVGKFRRAYSSGNALWKEDLSLLSPPRRGRKKTRKKRKGKNKRGGKKKSRRSRRWSLL